MQNDDNDLKDHSLPLLIKQSTDDCDDNAKPNLFDGSAKANLESLKGKLIHRDTQLDVHAPFNDEDYLMSDATSELTSQTYERQTARGEDVMPYTNLFSSSGPGSFRLPSVWSLLDTSSSHLSSISKMLIGPYHVIVECLSPEVDTEVLAMAFSAFGTMSDARVMYDNNSGKSDGYGFLAFFNKTDAEQAIATMNGKRLGSQEIRVSWSSQEDFAMPGSTDPSEGFPGAFFSESKDSTLFPDTRRYNKKVASAARIKSSQARRTKPGTRICALCNQTFTTTTNLKSKLSFADVVTHELINIFQTISMFTWALRSTVVVV